MVMIAILLESCFELGSFFPWEKSSVSVFWSQSVDMCHQIDTCFVCNSDNEADANMFESKWLATLSR